MYYGCTTAARRWSSHGGTGNGMQFEKQRPDFERTHQLIIPDLCAGQ
jgi:hypothetical protein